MKWLCLVLLCGVVAAGNANKAAASSGDAAWADILKAKKANASNAERADQLKAFYKTFPNHPRASDAWIKEQSLRPASTTPTMATAATAAPAASSFSGRVDEAKARIRKAQAAGLEAGLGEMERSGRKLAVDFPKETAGWEILLDAAQRFGVDKARQLYSDVAANAPTQQLKTAAVVRLRALNTAPRWVEIPTQQTMLPKIKPIALAFTAIDGRQVNLSQMAGKVVLVDFWATWCGPCRMEMPNVKKAYAELHDQGFEIIGVSFDKDLNALKQYVAANELPWPQFCDGVGWESAMSKEFKIRGIPTMYLVDKNGILRDENARENLSAKVRALLKE